MTDLVSTLWRSAPLIHIKPTAGGLLKRLKYCLRGLAMAPLTQKWFHILKRPEMSLIVSNSPALYHKLQRPYLNRLAPIRRRLAMLKAHYQFVTGHFPMGLIERIYAGPGHLLAELNHPELPTLQLRLRNSRYDKEGDLGIELIFRDLDQPVCVLTFSIVEYNSSVREIFAGGLQGNKAADKEMVIAITRAHHGLRPKALLFFALQQLAGLWQINRVRGVSDAMHIYRHFQRRRNVASCYDEFWQDCGGVIDDKSIYDLPVVAVERELSTLKANKRQMYRRRYAMLAELATLIKASFRIQIPVEYSEEVRLQPIPTHFAGPQVRAEENMVKQAR